VTAEALKNHVISRKFDLVLFNIYRARGVQRSDDAWGEYLIVCPSTKF